MDTSHKGGVSPDTFIPIAEECGQIDQLMEQVLAQACTAAAEWPPTLSISFNISPVQLQKGQSADKVRDIASKAGFPLKPHGQSRRTSPASRSGMGDATKNARASIACHHSSLHLPVPQKKFVEIDCAAVIQIEDYQSAATAFAEIWLRDKYLITEDPSSQGPLDLTVPH